MASSNSIHPSRARRRSSDDNAQLSPISRRRQQQQQQQQQQITNRRYRQLLPFTTGRRASLFVLACCIPFVTLVLLWQHVHLVSRLDSGLEYAAESYDWGDSMRQVANVVKFAAYESGFMKEGDDDEIDDAIDDDDQMNEGIKIENGISNASTNNNINQKKSDMSNHANELSNLHHQHNEQKETSGSIIPIDLSINHLKPISQATGKPPMPPLAPSASTNVTLAEDFLPVVRISELVFRWRHAPKIDSLTKDATKVSAYRIIVRRFIGCKDCRTGTGNNDNNDEIVLWDSDRVNIPAEEELPSSIHWASSAPLPSPGEILQWRVILWDAATQPHSSSWSKFAIGPSDEFEWQGKWIVHPLDMQTFYTNFTDKDGEVMSHCDLWKLRRPLPLFRARLSSRMLKDALKNEDDAISLASALLVVSGLGSFRVSMDGVPLSSSGPLDPAFTDYSKRVMYRGFDVTSFLINQQSGADSVQSILDQSHVIGITMGSGWWDHRPIDKGMVKLRLLPQGPITIIAQLFLTTSKGKVHVVIPTKGSSGETDERMESVWQVSRGYIRESDLFTGEIVDLSVMSTMEGFDTIDGWSNAVTRPTTKEAQFVSKPNHWISPINYYTDIPHKFREEQMAIIAKAMTREERTTKPITDLKTVAAPIGILVPSEIPPVMPMERIAPDEVHGLGSGRWLLDFGKGISGVLHFDDGLPTPIVPEKYPRAHGFKTATANGDSFITVIYGDSLETTTGDINRVLVAGLGLHDGGPRHISNPEGAQNNVQCFPEDHDGTLTQRDVYVIAKELVGSDTDAKKKMFSRAQQSHFTTHGFRFAEVCCTAEPPVGAHALMYRTAVDIRGTFDSSNVLLNGGYELVRNAFNSNMLSVQSDCPHREKLPYGGDLIANSPAAMHMFDMSAFYRKTVRDWMDAQWHNGAYTETSIWQDLNDYAGIGKGAGETVWATAPPVLTVRHMQHYDDLDFLNESLPSHIRWFGFLVLNFERGMQKKGYDAELRNYTGGGSGLGDWLGLAEKDLFLTHTAFYMASGRCMAYIARKVGNHDALYQKGFALANRIRNRIARLYLKNGFDDFDFPKGRGTASPGPEMSLFARIVPGEKRCIVLKNWFHRKGEMWRGDEETMFLNELDPVYAMEMFKTGELVKRNAVTFSMGFSRWQGLGEGILAIRYALKTLSDNGFHNIALRKATGFGFGTPEYMLSHNATTMWESWWRSEDVYSRNHPMLGGLAEWMPSAVAGVSLYPTTTGGRQVLFFPRFPKSAAMLQYASAVQGTAIGDFAIAWRFENLPADKIQYNSALVKIRVRMLIPPGGSGVFRLPVPVTKATKIILSHSESFPDLVQARKGSEVKCDNRRRRKMGFPFNWEYDREKKEWHKMKSSKSIGTPCESFLFSLLPLSAQWSGHEEITHDIFERNDTLLSTGIYDVIIDNWQLESEVDGKGRLGNIPEYTRKSYNVGPYCEDVDSWEWDPDDATHII